MVGGGVVKNSWVAARWWRGGALMGGLAPADARESGVSQLEMLRRDGVSSSSVVVFG